MFIGKQITLKNPPGKKWDIYFTCAMFGQHDSSIILTIIIHYVYDLRFDWLATCK